MTWDLSYFSLLWLKRLQICDLSKLEVEEKSRTSRDLLSDWGFGNAHTRIFIRPPTLTGHSFAALEAMKIKSSSFESPKLYSLKLNSKNSIAALSTLVRTCWKVPIYYINVVLVNLKWTALYHFIFLLLLLVILLSVYFYIISKSRPFLRHFSYQRGRL